MNKTTLYIATILLVSICFYYIVFQGNKPTTNDFGFGIFHLTLPSDWKKLEFQGIDSYVGGITNGTDTLTFDYGWYSYDFSSEEVDKQLFSIDTINGKIVLLTKPKVPGNGTIGMYVEKAFKKNKFNLIGRNIKNEDLIFDIFKSLKFKDSDTANNSKQMKFSDKITSYSGKSLFNMHCAACHHKNKKTVGPALASMESLEFKKWLLDSTYINQEDAVSYGINYHQKTFCKLLTKSAVDKLIEYSKEE